jgi:antibiotic biosynthesis monooxygenase (ABM) superfamily enzyme
VIPLREPAAELSAPAPAQPLTPLWLTLPGHREWLDDQGRALIGFARDSVRPEGGFWWLDDHGRPDRPVARSRMRWVAAEATDA